jgi:adenosine kinase
MKNAKKILVIGSLSYDRIMEYKGVFTDRIMPDKLHTISLSFLADTMHTRFGGTAANIGYTLRLLGMDPHIHAPAGHDFAPYAKFLRSHKIDLSGIKTVKDEPTGTYFALTDSNHNQIGSFYTGALKHAAVYPVTKSILSDAAYAIISPTTPVAMMQAVDACMSSGVPYLFDPAFQIADFSLAELLRGIDNADIVIGNDYEIALLAERLSLTHEALVKRCRTFVTTKGHAGSTIESHEEGTFDVPPVSGVEAIDPTGAGDAYRGGFIAGYLRGYDLLTSARMGSVAAAYTVELSGTVTHHYSKKAFSHRFVSAYKTPITV